MSSLQKSAADILYRERGYAMKNTNAKELNEQYKDCPTNEQEYEIDGRKYIVVSHYVGKKDLDEVVLNDAYYQAMNELLHA